MSSDSGATSAATGTLLDPRNKADLASIPGWFHDSDRHLFEYLLSRQLASETSGDLVELGCYLGKSAVLMGAHMAAGERFTVLDLFEGSALDDANQEEHQRSYSSLTRAAFESNYRRFHPDLPAIVQGPSSVILDHVSPGSCRFVHIDASHLFEHVAGDADAARALLIPDGIVAFDDFRSEHTPGVAAAAWQAVLDKGLAVIAVTESKLYGTWGDPSAVIEDIVAWIDSRGDGYVDRQMIAGREMLRIKVWDPPAVEDPEPAPSSQPAPVAAPAQTPAAGRRGLRKAAYDWLPPKIHRAVSHRLNPPG